MAVQCAIVLSKLKWGGGSACADSLFTSGTFHLFEACPFYGEAFFHHFSTQQINSIAKSSMKL